jgi:hypothetical protein
MRGAIGGKILIFSALAVWLPLLFAMPAAAENVSRWLLRAAELLARIFPVG